MREPLPDDDPRWLDRLRAGDARAFEELVIGYQHRVFGVALRMLGRRAEAEDVAQETFVRAHRALPGFRGDARLGTWLYAIASRLCLNRLDAADTRRIRYDDEAVARVADARDDPAGEVERRAREAAVHQAVAGLPPERRLVVVLCDLEGLSYEEAAAALDVPIGTVRSRLHRARMDLREALEKCL